MATPIAPRLNIPPLKGALVTVDPITNLKNAVVFQYNPETLRRSLKPSTVGAEEGDRSSAVRFTGAPVETISAEVEIDCVEALDKNDPVALELGIAPQLAILELLLYPSTQQVSQYQSQLAAGTIEVVPILALRTLFVWGPSRVVPVRLTGMSVTEELFGANLNPVRATVSLEMRVLSYSDVFPDNPDYQAFFSYQQWLENIAPYAQIKNPVKATGAPGAG